MRATIQCISARACVCSCNLLFFFMSLLYADIYTSVCEGMIECEEVEGEHGKKGGGVGVGGCTWLYLRSKLKERLKPEADCRGDEWGGVRGEAAFILLQNGLLLMLSVARDLMTRAHADTHTRGTYNLCTLTHSRAISYFLGTSRTQPD